MTTAAAMNPKSKVSRGQKHVRLKWLRAAVTAACVSVISLFLITSPITASAQNSVATGPSGMGINITNDDATAALSGIKTLLDTTTASIITTAANDSGTLNSQSDKFAGALAVLVLITAFLRFSGAHHAATAWVDVFEAIITVSMFMAVYTGYSQAGPGFYSWFKTLATHISGQSFTFTPLFSAMDTVLKGIASAIGDMNSDLGRDMSILSMCAMAILCLFIMLISALVFLYYSYLGMVQSAIGIVFGKIAIALGIHPMTRGFFMSWVGFMIHAGMFVAVSTAMQVLLATNIVSQIQTAAQAGGGVALTIETNLSMAGYSLILLLLSLEVPKIAGMFGSGAASGGFVGTLAKGFLPFK